MSRKGCQDFELKEHQLSVTKWLVNNPEQKGILIEFGVGTGKTLTAYNIAVALMEADMIDDVYFMIPASILVNFKKEGKRYFCGKNPPKSFHFASQSQKPQSLIASWNKTKGRRRLIIIDEAQRLRTQLDAKGRVPVVLNTINKMAQQATKVVILSATPMVNSPTDIVMPMNMFLPEPLPIGKDFERKFIDPTGSKPINQTKFLNLINNHVAWYNPSKIGVVENVPKTKWKSYETNLSKDQKDELLNISRKSGYRSITASIGSMKMGDSKQKNSFFNRSRQASITSKNMECSPKIVKITKLCRQSELPTIVYAEYKKRGIDVIYKCLLVNGGYSPDDILIVTGQTASTIKKREAIQNKFNQRYASGNPYPVILLSKAGREGLNFPGVGQVIITSPDWNVSNMEQAVGRATRMGSPVKVVQVYIMISGSSMFEESPDEHVYQVAKKKQKLINRFDVLLHKASIPLKTKEIKKLDDQIEAAVSNQELKHTEYKNESSETEFVEDTKLLSCQQYDELPCRLVSSRCKWNSRKKLCRDLTLKERFAIQAKNKKEAKKWRRENPELWKEINAPVAAAKRLSARRKKRTEREKKLIEAAAKLRVGRRRKTQTNMMDQDDDEEEYQPKIRYKKTRSKTKATTTPKRRTRSTTNAMRSPKRKRTNLKKWKNALNTMFKDVNV